MLIFWTIVKPAGSFSASNSSALHGRLVMEDMTAIRAKKRRGHAYHPRCVQELPPRSRCRVG
eukprot:1118231-Amphidinium_carterae.2